MRVVLVSLLLTFAGQVSEGDRLYLSGRFADALVQYREQAPRNLENPLLWARMADCELRLGRLQEAERSFRRAIDINGDFQIALVGLGKTAIAMGRPRDAMPLLSRALQLSSEDRDAQRTLARALGQLNQFPQAERLLKNLVKEDLQDTISWFYLGELLYRNGYYAGALSPLEKSLTSQTDSLQARIYHAVSLFKTGHTLEAEAEFSDLSNNPAALRDPDFLLVYAELLDETFRPWEALRRTDLAVEATPNSTMAHFWRARILMRLGRLTEAAEAAERSVELAPHLPFGHNLLVQIYRRQGRSEDAARQASWVREYQNRINRDPQP